MCCESNSQAPAPQETEFSKTLSEIMRERNANARKFGPLEDRAIAGVEKFQTPDYAQRNAAEAMGNVESGFAAEKARSDAELSSMGVNPNSGAFADRSLKLSLARPLGRAQAFNASNRATERLAFDALAGMAGRGDAKVGQAIGAASAGASDYTNRQRTLIDYRNTQDDMSGIGSLVGQGASMFAMLSSRKAKKDISPAKGALAQVRRMPAKNWTYKGDTQPHVGPMAEDYKAATGKGNGRTLSLPDLVGVQQAAITELDAKVKKLERKGKK